MYQILFVDDTPSMKVVPVVLPLSMENVDFSYCVKFSVNEALRYLREHSNEIDLVVTDLGLPILADGSMWKSRNGMDIINYLLKNELKIPIIIHSTTRPDQETIEKCVDAGMIIKRCAKLTSQTIFKLIQKNHVFSIESSQKGIYCFWIDSDDPKFIETSYQKLQRSVVRKNRRNASCNLTGNIMTVQFFDTGDEKEFQDILTFQPNLECVFEL